MEEETGEDTMQAAHKTRQHQGNHEAEATFGGEADLHKHYRRCKKNPGHINFIPIGDFKIEHLPPDYRDNLWLDVIRAEADLTCRLSVRYTSENRPKFHPEHPHLFYPFYQDRGYDWMRVGTGWVHNVYIYKEKDGRYCECKECSQPGTQTPKKKWGKIYINTACHVVFDSDEARHTTCHFFYDEGSSHISQCPSLTGLSVVEADIKRDWCRMKFVSHDMDLVEKLHAVCIHRNNLRDKVCDKQVGYNTGRVLAYNPVNLGMIDPIPQSTVVISHPHGLNKQVTVGMCTEMHILTSTAFEVGTYELYDTRYCYNTATCPGSSGAPVITLTENRLRMRLWYSHPHSEGGDWNNNKSGVKGEYLFSGQESEIHRNLRGDPDVYIASDTMWISK